MAYSGIECEITILSTEARSMPKAYGAFDEFCNDGRSAFELRPLVTTKGMAHEHLTVDRFGHINGHNSSLHRAKRTCPSGPSDVSQPAHLRAREIRKAFWSGEGRLMAVVSKR